MAKYSRKDNMTAVVLQGILWIPFHCTQDTSGLGPIYLPYLFFFIGSPFLHSISLIYWQSSNLSCPLNSPHFMSFLLLGMLSFCWSYKKTPSHHLWLSQNIISYRTFLIYPWKMQMFIYTNVPLKFVRTSLTIIILSYFILPRCMYLFAFLCVTALP